MCSKAQQKVCSLLPTGAPAWGDTVAIRCACEYLASLLYKTLRERQTKLFKTEVRRDLYPVN
ncbi:MAG: hypothetical protein RMY62_005365 [Nostoc sp. ZfuVER08]|nr:hypothetical protein [Nostoc sp. GBBB01]MDZ8012768.1 hypothetical protein [Nostoc sp. ZfuVER08]